MHIYVTGYRYMTLLYDIAVEARFYSNAVECKTLCPADLVSPPVGENVNCNFHLLHLAPIVNNPRVHKTP